MLSVGPCSHNSCIHYVNGSFVTLCLFFVCWLKLKLKTDDKIVMRLWSLFGRKKNSFYNIVLEKEGFWARKLIFLPLLMKPTWQRMQRSECCSVGCINQWLKTEICSYLYLDATCAWPSPECHDSTSHPFLSPRSHNPRDMSPHPSKTVLLFEVTVPLVVGWFIYLFILVKIARTPTSYTGCLCACPNAVNI